MHDVATLERIASKTLAATGYEDPPVDALDLAECCGLDVRWRRGAGHMMGRVMYIDPQARPERQHGNAAHELAHALLRDHSLDDDETSVRYLAACLLVPRAALVADLEAGACLVALRVRHVNASHELIARRIADVQAAVITIYDDGKVRTRIGSRWMGPPPRISALEESLADRAFATETVQRDGATHAVPVIGRYWRRVIVVATT